MISLIVAMDANHLIGSGGDLPWHLSEDLKRFKKLTTGNVVIMGRKTYDSIEARLGGPLPDRISIVITGNPEWRRDGVVVSHSLSTAVGHARLFGEREIFIIGGARVYAESLREKIPDRLYITRVEGEYTGDTWFPEIPDGYALTESEAGTQATYEVWERKS